MAKDLVCQMEVDETSPDTLKFDYQGETYYFCTNLCMVQFQAHPEKFVRRKDAPSGILHKGKGNPSGSA